MYTYGELDLIAMSFGVFNLLRLVSYAPQIAAVARDSHGAIAISFTCWSIWVGSNATTAIYVWVKLGDPILALVSAFNATCCLAVLALAACKRAAAHDRRYWIASTLSRRASGDTDIRNRGRTAEGRPVTEENT